MKAKRNVKNSCLVFNSKETNIEPFITVAVIKQNPMINWQTGFHLSGADHVLGDNFPD